MQNTPSPAITALWNTLRQAGGIQVFVETGSGRGDLSAAVGDIFDTVITFESDKALYEAAHERLSGHKGLLPLTGDTRELLPNLMPRLVAPAAFWLASHLMSRDGGETPLLAELAAVTDSPMGHSICIPGADLLMSAADRPAGWPSLATVLAGLDHGGVRNIGLCETVLVAVPRENTVLREALFPHIVKDLDVIPKPE